MTKYINQETGAEEELRYAFAIRPYESNRGTFAIDISIHPPRMIYPGYDCESVYPEAFRLIKERTIDVDKHFQRSVGHKWGITLHFSKEDTDETIIEILENVQNMFLQLGINHAGMVVVIAGIPDITYGQNYLEHTTSAKELILLDLIGRLCPTKDVFIKAMADVPIVSAQDFNPDADTNLVYLDEVTSAGLRKILSRDNILKGVSDVLESLLGDVEARIKKNAGGTPTEETKKEKTYSTKNSEEYNNFQNNWI